MEMKKRQLNKQTNYKEPEKGNKQTITQTNQLTNK